MIGEPAALPLLQMALRVEQDIFVIRQRGREVAAVVGLEHQDQVRIATALSEVARDLLRTAGGADVLLPRRRAVPTAGSTCAPTWPRCPRCPTIATSRSPARCPDWSTH